MSDDARKLGDSIESIVQRANLLISSEIELAKAEITEKVTKLGRGAVVAVAAGVFAIWALLMFFFGLASLITWAIGGAPFWGFFIVMALLLVLAALAGLFAYRSFKVGAPTPQMAIDEARLIKETVQSDDPESTTASAKEHV